MHMLIVCCAIKIAPIAQMILGKTIQCYNTQPDSPPRKIACLLDKQVVSGLHGLSGHFATGLGATAAGLDAGIHVIQLFATCGASIAYGSAYPTHFTVVRRAH